MKAHLDFLMMTGLLFVFFLLFGQLRMLGRSSARQYRSLRDEFAAPLEKS